MLVQRRFATAALALISTVYLLLEYSMDDKCSVLNSNL